MLDFFEGMLHLSYRYYKLALISSFWHMRRIFLSLTAIFSSWRSLLFNLRYTISGCLTCSYSSLSVNCWFYRLMFPCVYAICNKMLLESPQAYTMQVAELIVSLFWIICAANCIFSSEEILPQNIPFQINDLIISTVYLKGSIPENAVAFLLDGYF